MPTTLESVVNKYLRSGSPAQRTREEYSTTLRKWSRWTGAVTLERLGRKEIREFLDWVYEDAESRQGSNPGRTTNKVRSHLRAALSWAHYAHRAPLAFKAILSLPQPTAFKTLAPGFEGQCPCCRRRFTEANS